MSEVKISVGGVMWGPEEIKEIITLAENRLVLMSRQIVLNESLKEEIRKLKGRSVEETMNDESWTDEDQAQLRLRGIRENIEANYYPVKGIAIGGSDISWLMKRHDTLELMLEKHGVTL